jgi:hypothetical protein
MMKTSDTSRGLNDGDESERKQITSDERVARDRETEQESVTKDHGTPTQAQGERPTVRSSDSKASNQSALSKPNGPNMIAEVSQNQIESRTGQGQLNNQQGCEGEEYRTADETQLKYFTHSHTMNHAPGNGAERQLGTDVANNNTYIDPKSFIALEEETRRAGDPYWLIGRQQGLHPGGHKSNGVNNREAEDQPGKRRQLENEGDELSDSQSAPKPEYTPCQCP